MCLYLIFENNYFVGLYLKFINKLRKIIVILTMFCKKIVPRIHSTKYIQFALI